MRVAAAEPFSFSDLRSVAGSVSTPRFLISSVPIPRSRRARPRALDVGGQLFAHAERRDERTRQGRIRGEVGDPVGEHARLQRPRHIPDEARADHGTVRLVHEGAERADRLVRGIRGRRQLVSGITPHHQGCAPHALTRQRPRPQHEFDGRAVRADPLRLDVVGHGVAVEAGAELDAGRQGGRQAEGPIQRRGVIGDAHPRGLAVPRRAPRGVHPHRIDGGQIGCLGQPVSDGHAVAERGQVVRRDRGGHLVGVDGIHVEPEGGQAQRIAADAAAQVGHAGQARDAESGGMTRRDRRGGWPARDRRG